MNKMETMIESAYKMTMYKICRSNLTNGCKIWTLKQRQKNKLHAVEMKYLRRVRGVTRRNKLRNDII